MPHRPTDRFPNTATFPDRQEEPPIPLPSPMEQISPLVLGSDNTGTDSKQLIDELLTALRALPVPNEEKAVLLHVHDPQAQPPLEMDVMEEGEIKKLWWRLHALAATILRHLPDTDEVRRVHHLIRKVLAHALVQAPPKDVTEGMREYQAALKWFLYAAPQEAQDLFRPVMRAAEERGGVRQCDESGMSEEWKWLLSILLWWKYEKQGQTADKEKIIKEVVLEELRALLKLDRKFFSAQWWVSELCTWSESGDKIAQLLRARSTGPRGRPSRRMKMTMVERDQRIVATFERHLLHNSANRAQALAYSELKREGILGTLALKGFREVCEKTLLLPPPEGTSSKMRYRRVYYAVDLLQQRGLTPGRPNRKWGRTGSATRLRKRFPQHSSTTW